MRRHERPRRRKPGRGERGFTFVELMIAIALGLFLIGGLLTLVQAMRRTNTNQSGLSQLQDSERMAMQLITDVVQSTGYYVQPPITNSAAASFPAGTFGSAVFTYAGQGLVGNYTAGGPDMITNRYQTNGSALGDNAINCTGNASAAPASFVNQIRIATVGATSYLTCTLWLNGAQQPDVPLVPGVTNMTVLYGVETGNGVATNSVDTYLNAAAVTDWSTVRSVQVTLTFTNPLAGQPGQQTGPTINFTRTIAVMYKTGVTT